MKKSIKASSLVAGVILAGVASPALAEEITATAPVATPVVSDQNQTVTQEVVDSAKTAVVVAEGDVSKQQAVVDTANQAVTDATAEVEDTSKVFATAKSDATAATPEAIKVAEETFNKAQGELVVAQTEQRNADETVSSAQEAVTYQEKEVSTATTELTNAETALKVAQSQVPTITLSEEYKYALKQLEDYRYAGVEGSRSNNDTNNIDINSADHKNAYDQLKTISESLFETNTYQGSSDEEQVDLSNMTDEQRIEVNSFALSLINNIRNQFGKAPLVTTKGLFDFANEVANNNSKRYINSDTAEYRVHNDAAQKFGLSTFDEAWTTKSKQNFFVAAPTNLLPEKEKFKRQYTQGETTIDAPVLTMGELKENIYTAFKMQLFNTDNVGGVVRVKDFSVRSWEQAMLISGGAYSERASQFALSINAPLHSYPSDLDPGVYTKYYGIKINTFVINDSVEDTWKVNTIVDPSKFDTTVLKDNSQQKVETAVAKLQEAKDSQTKATQAVTDTQTKLNDAQLELTQLQETLGTVKANAENAQKNVTSKQTDLDNAKAELSRLQTAADNLKKVQAAVDTANQKKELADQVLQEATNKLAELEEAFKLAKENYEELLKLYEASQPVINSKGQQVPPTHFLPEAKIELKEVAFETVYENDSTLLLGQEAVVREGKSGSTQVITIGDQVTEIVVTEKVDKLVKRGTLVNEDVKPEEKPEVKPVVAKKLTTEVTKAEIKAAYNRVLTQNATDTVLKEKKQVAYRAELPKTGEEDTAIYSLVGLFSLGLAGSLINKRNI